MLHIVQEYIQINIIAIVSSGSKLIITEVQVNIHSNCSVCVWKTLILHFQNKVHKNYITIQVENNK